MSNPYLQHLITDPTFGYLFPHRLAVAAFGVPNEYHLRKHYPRLIEGQHYLKIRGADHVERLFYTLVGLLNLADLVNTPQAQTFKQVLVQHTQPGGSLVPSPTQLPIMEAETSSQSLFNPPHPSSLAPLAAAPLAVNDPAYLVAQYLTPQLEQAIDRTLTTRFSNPISPTYQSPQDTAALIFEAQRVASEQAQQTAQTLLQAQRLITEQPQQSENPIHLHLNTWFAEQDPWAMTLITVALIALSGIGTYFLALAVLKPVPAPTPTYPQSIPQPIPQTTWR